MGLRSIENGQMVDADNQFQCFRCYNEANAERLKAEDKRARCPTCGGPGLRHSKDNCILYLRVVIEAMDRAKVEVRG